MSKMIGYLKASAGEASLLTRLGLWRQAVSLTVDQLVDLVQLISGGGLLPATGTTQGSRPLSGYNTALLQTGDEVFVQGVNELYYFDAASALAADQLNVVNAVGPGQFIRKSVIVNANWWVDAVNGDDESSGTSALTPLQTLGELTRRLNSKTLWTTISTMTISITGVFNEILDLHFDAPATATINVNFSTTVADSGTIGTYTAFSAGAGIRASILDGAQDFTAYQFTHRIRSTSGANIGAVTHLASLAGVATTANIGQFAAANTFGTVNPVNGTTYDVQAFSSSCTGFDIGVTGNSTMIVDGMRVVGPASGTRRCKAFCGPNNLFMIFFGCQFDHSLGGGISIGGSVRLVSCSNIGSGSALFSWSDLAANILNQCHYGITSVTQSIVTAQAGMHDGNGTKCVSLGLTGKAMITDVSQRGFFGNINGSFTVHVQVEGFATWSLGSNFWGAAGNTVTNALRVRNGSGVNYVAASLPSATGATPGQDYILSNAAAAAWATLPALAVSPDNSFINIRQ